MEAFQQALTTCIDFLIEGLVSIAAVTDDSSGENVSVLKRIHLDQNEEIQQSSLFAKCGLSGQKAQSGNLQTGALSAANPIL